MLFLRKIKRSDWLSEQKKLGTEIKWFGLIPIEANASFFMIENCDLIQTKKIIGACFIYNIDSNLDWSFFILPELRREGYAREFILEVISNFEHIQFTVSKFNQPSLNLFKSIYQLENTLINENNNTFIFKPI